MHISLALPKRSLDFIVRSADVRSRTIQIAPPHYPCSLVRANETMEAMDGVVWANAVPAAQVSVDVTIKGTRLQFEGLGYHDKVSYNMSRTIRFGRPDY